MRKDDSDAKFWLFPIVSVGYNRGFGPKVLAELIGQVETRRAEIERTWNEHFG